MVPNKDNIQARFFKQISRTISPTVSLVDELESVLNMSTNSVYRRIKGEISLTIEEIELLCNMYRVSFDSLCSYTGNTVTFDFSPMTDETSFKNYLLSIVRDLEVVYKNKTGRAVYACEDIPLFHNFGFPALAKFKLFYWMKSVMNVESLQRIKYNSRLISDDILAAGRDLYDMYAKIPSIEIWTEITPISLFKQIEFFWESNLFETKEVALAICDEVREEFAILQQAATQGCKFNSQKKPVGGDNNYQLYWSEIEIGNNCILTDVEGVKTAYLSFNTFNKLSTRDIVYCEEMDKWQKNLISKSNPLSGVSEKKRSQFFKKLDEGLENTRMKIIVS